MFLDRWFDRKLEHRGQEIIDKCKKTVHEHERLDDYWQEIDLTDVYDTINTPAGFFAGWYDIFVKGNIEAYMKYGGENTIVIDPLGHCQTAWQYFPSDDLIIGRSFLPIFQFLNMISGRPLTRSNIKAVTFYVMSSNDDVGSTVGNYWTTLDLFPDSRPVQIYINGDGKASTLKPFPSSLSSSSYSSFVYDPANPVPTVGGNNLAADYYDDCLCGPLDQSEVDRRDDILVFETDALLSELAITGAMYATLYVSSDAIDTDFMVKLSDVYLSNSSDSGSNQPRVAILQDNAVTMRWRNATAVEPEFMEADQVYKVELDLWNTSYVFAPGHALRISITSSNYPRFKVNNNNGLALKDQGLNFECGPRIVAKNSIYHSEEYPSHITLPVIDAKATQLPRVSDLKGTIIRELKNMAVSLPFADVELEVEQLISKYQNGLLSSA
jgi:putative CocE/NonD family hydrolase